MYMAFILGMSQTITNRFIQQRTYRNVYVLYYNFEISNKFELKFAGN